MASNEYKHAYYQFSGAQDSPFCVSMKGGQYIHGTRYILWAKLNKFGIILKLIQTHFLEKAGLCNLSPAQGTLKNKSTTKKSWTWQKSIIRQSFKSSQKQVKRPMKTTKVTLDHKMILHGNINWKSSMMLLKITTYDIIGQTENMIIDDCWCDMAEAGAKTSTSHGTKTPGHLGLFTT